MKKLRNLLNINHLTIGIFIKTVSDKGEQYIAITKAIGNARHFALTDEDYLMLCNMRALARYMDVFGWNHWAKNIIESSFGYFKERKSDNRMYGVTGFVMVLPLHNKLSTL